MRKIEDDYLPQGEHIAVESYCKKPDNLIPIFVNQEIITRSERKRIMKEYQHEEKVED